jgi:hypothetical protein
MGVSVRAVDLIYGPVCIDPNVGVVSFPVLFMHNHACVERYRGLWDHPDDGTGIIAMCVLEYSTQVLKSWYIDSFIQYGAGFIQF